MKEQKHDTDLASERLQENLLLEEACLQASQELCAAVGQGYRKGSRRADWRHAVASVAVCLCLVLSSVALVGWMYPYTMGGGDRHDRIAAYETTQQMLRQI